MMLFLKRKVPMLPQLQRSGCKIPSLGSSIHVQTGWPTVWVSLGLSYPYVNHIPV